MIRTNVQGDANERILRQDAFVVDAPQMKKQKSECS